MNSFLQTPALTADNLFPLDWLMSGSILNRINQTATGIGLFKALRCQALNKPVPANYPGSPIVDFHYLLINPVLQAITRVTREDCVNLPLSALIPEGVKTTLISRMAHVVETGHPQQYNDVFKRDGIVSQHNQVCVKAGDGVLVLVMDVTYLPLCVEECRRRTELMEAIWSKAPVEVIRNRLLAVIT